MRRSTKARSSPNRTITLYYKLHTQYYTLVIDYGEHGDFSFEVARAAKRIALPSVSPAGTEVLGFAEEQGGGCRIPRRRCGFQSRAEGRHRHAVRLL